MKGCATYLTHISFSFVEILILYSDIFVTCHIDSEDMGKVQESIFSYVTGESLNW